MCLISHSYIHRSTNKVQGASTRSNWGIRFVGSRLNRVKHALIKFGCRNDAYAYAVVGQFFKALNYGGAAVKSVNYPVGIYEIAHTGLALLLLPCAGQPGLVDIPYEFIGIMCAFPEAGGRPQRFEAALGA